MSDENRVTMEPEFRSMLGRHREELLRRALKLAVTRSTLDELTERPLAARLEELELLFEAASAEGGGESPRAARVHDLRSVLDRQLDEHRRDNRIFSVAVVTAGPARIARLDKGFQDRPPGPDGRAWTNALRECAAPTDVVIDAGDGATAIVFPDHDAREARIAAERLCRAAWRSLGENGPLADAGVATYPEDGSSGTEIVAAAYDALWRQADFVNDGHGEAAEEPPDDRPPAPVHPLRPL